MTNIDTPNATGEFIDVIPTTTYKAAGIIFTDKKTMLLFDQASLPS